MKLQSPSKGFFDRYIIHFMALLGLGIWAYIFVSAAQSSMTHDEASSWILGRNYVVWECFFSDYCWGSANLHPLNTLLFHFTTYLGGPEEFWVRLPNVLCYGIYLFFSIRLIREMTSIWQLNLLGFALLHVNPYLLDFFSVARGYGMGTAWVMMSLFFVWRYYRENSQRLDPLWAWLSCFLAVMSNFTFLNYLALLLGFGLVWGVREWKGRRPALHFILWGLPFFILVFILLSHPITVLKGKAEFLFGFTSIWQTFESLVLNSNYGQGYLGKPTKYVLYVWLTLLSFISLGLGGWNWWKNGKGNEEKASRLGSYLFGGLSLGLVVQYYLLGTFYLSHRTAILFIPLFATMIFTAALFLHQKYPFLIKIFALSWFLLSAWHLSRTLNTRLCREWAYDSQTKNMVLYLEDHIPEGEEIKLGINWLFSHSISYYMHTDRLTVVSDIGLKEDIRSDTYYDFYYIRPGEEDKLHPDYELLKIFGKEGLLYKRKGPNP